MSADSTSQGQMGVSHIISGNASSTTIDKNKQHVQEEEEEELVGSCIQARYLVIFAAFLANASGYIMRVNLSVAIVAIALKSDNNNATTFSFEDSIPTYDWDESTRSALLSSFFWGYVITQIPSGYLAQRFGPRKLLFALLLICTVATLLFVPATSLGWQWACVARVVLGLAQGGLLPCSHALLAKWSHPSERGRMSVYSYSGQPFGTVVALSGSGILASTSYGWPLIFYVSGAIGLTSSLIWFWLVADAPSQHRLASPKERHYIESGIGTRSSVKSQHLDTPWKSIITSKAFIALLIAHSVQNWGFWTLLTQIPSYMKGVLNFDLKENGLLSALPYLAMWGCGIIFSWIFDMMLHKKFFSVGTSRKIGNSIGHYGSAIALIVLGYVSADSVIAVSLLTIAVASNAGTMIGYQVNHIDLSPNFAGTMMGITNCVGNIMSILGPLLVGIIVKDNSNSLEWRIVFLVAAGFYIVGNTIFVIFGSGELQQWNNPNTTTDKNEEEGSHSHHSAEKMNTNTT